MTADTAPVTFIACPGCGLPLRLVTGRWERCGCGRMYRATMRVETYTPSTAVWPVAGVPAAEPAGRAG